MKLSKRIMNLEESATLAVSAKAARMRAEGIDVIGFGAGEPDFDTPDRIKKAVMAALDAGHTGYSNPASGIAEAKQAICGKLARENGLQYRPEQVVITNGGKLAMNLLIHALINPKDEVLIPAPYWVSVPEITKLAGGVPKFVAGPEDKDYKLSPQDLERALTDRTRIFVLTSPSNPSGVTYWPNEIRALAEVLEKHDITILADEIYDRLVYDDQTTISYASVSERAYAQTVTLNAASKTYAMTGWRIGYAAGPAEIIKAMGKLLSQSTSGAVTFNQYALVEALSGDQSGVESMRMEFQKRAQYMYGRLTAIPGIKCPKPTGAFYCFPNVSAFYESKRVSGSTEFADRLLEESRVAVVPGAAFGMDHHVRLSFATSLAQIEEGLDRLESFLR